MKRFFPNPFNVLIVLAVLALLFIAGTAHAGIFDRFQNVAIDKLISAGIAGIFFVLSAFLGAKILKYKKLTSKGKDFILWVYESTRPDSPGGAKITGDEIDKGLPIAGELGAAALEAFAQKNGGK